MSLIRFVTGNESLSVGSTRFYAQVMPCAGFMSVTKPTYVSEAARAGLIASQGRAQRLSASTSGLTEQGTWWDGTYQIPDGMVLRLFAHQNARIGGRNGFLRERRAAVFIRAREDAPLQRLVMSALNDPLSAQVTVIVEGRFDIITLREAGASRVPITPQDLVLCKAEAVQELLTHTVVAPALRAPQRTIQEVVREHDGKEVVISTKRTSRAVNLGD